VNNVYPTVSSKGTEVIRSDTRDNWSRKIYKTDFEPISASSFGSVH